MEGFSLSCNIIAVLTLAGQLTELGTKYAKRAKTGTQEQDVLLLELKALSEVLECVKRLVDDPAAAPGHAAATTATTTATTTAAATTTTAATTTATIATATTASGNSGGHAVPETAKSLRGLIDRCGNSLKEMLQKLEGHDTGSQLMRKGSSLSWPLKAEETRDWAQRIRRYKANFPIALSADEL